MVYNSVASSTFTMLYNHHLLLILKHCHHPKRKLYKHEAVAPNGILSPAPGTNSWLSVSMNVPILDIPCNCNDTLCGILYLASFTQHDVSEVHSCCNLYRDFIFTTESYFIVCAHHDLFILSSFDLNLGSFNLLALDNHATMSICVQIFV